MIGRCVLYVLLGASAFALYAVREPPKATPIHVVKTVVVPHRDLVHVGTQK